MFRICFRNALDDLLPCSYAIRDLFDQFLIDQVIARLSCQPQCLYDRDSCSNQDSEIRGDLRDDVIAIDGSYDRYIQVDAVKHLFTFSGFRINLDSSEDHDPDEEDEELVVYEQIADEDE